MKFRSVFDIIGPVMIGPSSSHTAGAARIGRVARTLFGRQPEWARIHLYGSFAETYKGHGTDVAIIGGLLDYDTFDERIKTAFADAEKVGMTFEFIPEEEEADHPNTARLVIGDSQGEMELTGISIGGGKMEVVELNGFPLTTYLDITRHFSSFMKIVQVSLQAFPMHLHQGINIAHMEVGRKEKGEMALNGH